MAKTTKADPADLAEKNILNHMNQAQVMASHVGG